MKPFSSRLHEKLGKVEDRDDTEALDEIEALLVQKRNSRITLIAAMIVAATVASQVAF